MKADGERHSTKHKFDKMERDDEQHGAVRTGPLHDIDITERSLFVCPSCGHLIDPLTYECGCS